MSIRDGYVKMYSKAKEAKVFPHTLITKQEIRDKLEDMLDANEIREMLQLCYLAYYEKVVFSGDTRWPQQNIDRFRELRTS